MNFQTAETASGEAHETRALRRASVYAFLVDEERVVELRLGSLRPDGSIRYIVRPIEWIWIVGTEVVGVGLATYLLLSSPSSWITLPIFAVIPVFMTFRSGFDVRLGEKEIVAWNSLGPIRYSSFTVTRLKPPEIRSVKELIEDSNRTQRVTYLHWGARSLRTTIPRPQVSELVSEVEALLSGAEIRERRPGR